MVLKCELVTKLTKDLKEYEVLEITFTDNYKKKVFLEPAEKELINIIKTNFNNTKK